MEKYIREKLATIDNSKTSWKESKGDILDIALLDPDYGKSASMSELVDQVKTFFFAGHDTTASTISWCYYFLSHQVPEYKRFSPPLVGSISATTIEDFEAMARDVSPSEIDVLEVRPGRAPIVPGWPQDPAAPVRETTENYHFRTTSGRIFTPPSKTMIYTSSWLLHRNHAVWGDDADEFKPERFMPGKSIPWGFIAFSKRPRDCIGFSLAYLEVYKSLVWLFLL